MEKHIFTKVTGKKLRLHFNLKQTSDKEKLTQIMLVTTINGQRIRVYTKLRIEPKYWDKSSGRCHVSQDINLRERKRLSLVNRQLKTLVKSVYQTDEQLAKAGRYLTSNDVRALVSDEKSDKHTPTSPMVYLHNLVENYPAILNRRGKRGISSTQKTYFTALNRLESFCQATQTNIQTFDDFDQKLFSSFANYLNSCTYQKGKQSQHYTQNTIVNTLKVIKNLLHRAYDNEMTENNRFQKVQTVLPSDVSEQIYLEEKEIQKLSKLDITCPKKRQVRDLFIISCYTALRISDLQKLKDATISNGTITLYQTKTKEQVEIPIFKEIAPLLSFYQKHGFPSINPCKANKIIKELACQCGINAEISYKEHRGGIIQIKKQPKWQMISFHTARRSCITNLYKRGYPVNYIMTLSGHHSIQAFQRYMRASSKELLAKFVTLLKKEKAL